MFNSPEPRPERPGKAQQQAHHSECPPSCQKFGRIYSRGRERRGEVRRCDREKGGWCCKASRWWEYRKLSLVGVWVGGKVWQNKNRLTSQRAERLPVFIINRQTDGV